MHTNTAMTNIRSLRALGAMDADSLLADPLLRWMAVLPLAIALAVRFILPLASVKVGELAGVDLAWLEPLLAAYAVAGMAPLLAGTVVGLLLLDQRDDRTLLALRVTPLPLWAYLAYRLAAPTVVAAAITLAAFAVAGGLGLTVGGVLLAALAATPLAPVSALALAALARNKVEGLALMKAASVLLAAPLAGLFLPPAGQAALTILPTTLVARAVWAIQAGESPWSSIAAGWVLCALLAALLLWRLRRSLSGE
jgi:fluoroquinolone transport system permease protein